MAEPFIGQIQMFGFNFAPRGWAMCNAQILSIAQNTALFSLLGTIYGGNGQTTFSLPDLRGRVPIHMGQGPGLSDYVEGQTGGSENKTLTINNLPAHSHAVNAKTENGNKQTPGANVLAKDAAGSTAYYSNQVPNTTMNPAMIGNTGGSQPFSNLQPFLTINFCIALQGIFPSRN